MWQRKLQRRAAARATAQSIISPQPGLNGPGFIDHDDGANLRAGPAEQGGAVLLPTPLRPATRVFVSGQHPAAPAWWYVSAVLEDTLVRGYVQGFRVCTDLPEPGATLYQIQPGDTAEGLAARQFGGEARPGHDLRFYENVLLAVNRDAGRRGVRGTFQHPGLLGGGANNVQLEAGRRIWLVSAAFARGLLGTVPSGSLTGGLYGKGRRALRRMTDLLSSVLEAPQHLGEIGAEVAAVLREHLPALIGVTAAFLSAEALAAVLAATPTGVTQLVAALIQLLLAALCIPAVGEALGQALEHGRRWLTLALGARGNPAQISAASMEFLRMLVTLALAALAAAGVRSGVSKSLRIAAALRLEPQWAYALAGGGRAPSGLPQGLSSSGPVRAPPSLMTGAGRQGGQLPALGEGGAAGAAEAGAGAPLSGRKLSAAEQRVADELVAAGHTVEAVPESTVRTADFLVDGVPTELKTITNLSGRDLSGALGRRILEGAGQAPHIIADVRGQAGMTRALAERAIRRAYGADSAARIQRIRVIGSDFDITVPRIGKP